MIQFWPYINAKLFMKKRKYSTILAMLFLVGALMPERTHAKDDVPKNIYEIKAKGIDGKTIDFAKFKGKKILIVNTTSLATDNVQYAELEALYNKYKGKLVVVGFLSVDFLKPPGKRDFSPRDISEYKVTFPLGAQVILNGRDIAPIYKWLTDVSYNNYKNTEIKWDFQKYLINENGELVAEFDPKVRVTEAKVIEAIEK